MNALDIFQNSLLSEAAYANFADLDFSDETKVKTALQRIGNDPDKPNEPDDPEQGFSASQAEEFVKHWRIVSHQPNTDHGFSATVFEALDENGNGTGEFSFAIRGSEAKLWTTKSDWLTNFGDVGPDGIAIHQAIDLYNYYLRLTATGDDVVQYTYHEEVVVADTYSPASISSETVATDTFADQSQIGVLTGKQFSVTGHSLGGHLALIMERLAPAMVTAVDEFNAVGFDANLNWIQAA